MEPTALDGVTVADKVMGVPVCTGPVGDVLRVVVVTVAGTVVTMRVAGDDVEVDQTAESVGTNLAVRLREPTANDVVEVLATPLTTATGEPIAVAPSRNCTAPTAPLGDTVALKVTLVPAVVEPDGETDSAMVVAVPVTTVG